MGQRHRSSESKPVVNAGHPLANSGWTHAKLVPDAFEVFVAGDLGGDFKLVRCQFFSFRIHCDDFDIFPHESCQELLAPLIDGADRNFFLAKANARIQGFYRPWIFYDVPRKTA